MKNNSDRNDKFFDIILEESLDKYSDDIASQDIDCNMTEEEIRTMENKEKVIYDKLIKNIDSDKKSYISIRKTIILVAILLFGVIGVSFGAPAIYNWFQRSNMKMSGTDLNIFTEKLIFEDYNNIKNFKNKPEIIIPNWLPDGMELTKINDEENSLVLFYKKNDHFVTMDIVYDMESSTQTIDTENNNYTVRDSVILDMQCKIITLTSEAGLTIHSVYWNSDNTSYTLMTNVTEEELGKILENLIYFEE